MLRERQTERQVLNHRAVFDACIEACRLALQDDQSPYAQVQGCPEYDREVFTLSREHGLVGLLHHGIKRSGRDSRLDPGLLHEMESEAEATRVRQAVQTELVRDLTSCLAERGVKHAVLKGLAFAHQYYPTSTCRRSADVDILVDPADRILAVETLKQASCHFRTSVDEARGTCRASPCASEAAFVRNKVIVELHWDLADWHLRTEDGPTGHLVRRMLERAAVVRIGSTDVPALVAEDALLHSCLHLFLHPPPRRLIWLFDVALLRRWVSDDALKYVVVPMAEQCSAPRLLGTALHWVLHLAAMLGLTPPGNGNEAMSAVILKLFGWRRNQDTMGFPTRLDGAAPHRFRGNPIIPAVLLPAMAARSPRAAAHAFVRRLFPYAEDLQAVYGSYYPGATHVWHVVRTVGDVLSRLISLRN